MYSVSLILLNTRVEIGSQSTSANSQPGGSLEFRLLGRKVLQYILSLIMQFLNDKLVSLSQSSKVSSSFHEARHVIIPVR